MKKNKRIISFLCLLSAICIFGISLTQADEAPARKIVVFQPGFNDIAKDQLVGKFQGFKLKRLGIINAQAVMLSQKAAREIMNQPGVLRVEDDAVVQIIGSNSIKVYSSDDVAAQPQALPWGVERINANDAWAAGDTGTAIKVGIIDTGISNTHPDLIGNIKGGVNTIAGNDNWNDDNGHGSHVAGIVAALDNAEGVVGAGPQIDLYAIKVMDSKGSGYISDVIEGLDWAVANKMQVVNMSLGTSSNIQSFHDAVARAKNAGIVVVAAAGNSGGAVGYPGAYPEAIGVSATGSDNLIASWSSRGPQVDLAAPGVNIFSTYMGTGYATLSGTSMASPHVAGAAALVLANNGSLTPDQVQARLQNTAHDLGDAGFDNFYGWGLVDAYAASGFSGLGDNIAPSVSLTSPADGVAYTDGQTVIINADASDNVGVIRVDFYDGNNLLGRVASSPFSYNWAITSANNGSHTLVAKAFDAAGNSADSGPVSVTVDMVPPPDTIAPAVSLTSPANNTNYTSAQTVNIAATATDNAGVSKVELYVDNVLKGSNATSSCSYGWVITGVDNGTHSLTAVAYDAAGNTKISSAVTVTVNIDTIAPTVSITAPADNAVYTRTQTLYVTAVAADNVKVAKVMFYDGATLIGTDTSSPYSYYWPISNSNNGTHSLTAVAYDTAGNSAVSIPVTVNVDTIAPTVSITSPASKAVYATAQTVTVAASATDNIGVAKVEFYDGSVLLGTDATLPFSYDWAVTNANNGSHSLTAKAYDAAGNTKVSAAIIVSVDTIAPTVSMTGPADNSVYTRAQTLYVAANAADNIKVAKVMFYDGATLIGTDTASPYSYYWSISKAKNSSHSLTAVAYDVAGNSTVSTPVNVTISIP
jgi:hypothetical protein